MRTRRPVTPQNEDKAADVIAQFAGVNRDVIDEALKHATLDVAVAKEGPKFGFTKADMSDKVPSYFDLTDLAEATGLPPDHVGHLRKQVCREPG
jgi:hypothetical protein